MASLFVPPAVLNTEDMPHQGGFLVWGADMKLHKHPLSKLPKGPARLAQVIRNGVVWGDESAMHVEYDLPDSDIILVTYWTHGGKRIA